MILKHQSRFDLCIHSYISLSPLTNLHQLALVRPRTVSDWSAYQPNHRHRVSPSHDRSPSIKHSRVVTRDLICRDPLTAQPTPHTPHPAFTYVQQAVWKNLWVCAQRELWYCSCYTYWSSFACTYLPFLDGIRLTPYLVWSVLTQLHSLSLGWSLLHPPPVVGGLSKSFSNHFGHFSNPRPICPSHVYLPSIRHHTFHHYAPYPTLISVVIPQGLGPVPDPSANIQSSTAFVINSNPVNSAFHRHVCPATAFPAPIVSQTIMSALCICYWCTHPNIVSSSLRHPCFTDVFRSFNFKLSHTIHIFRTLWSSTNSPPSSLHTSPPGQRQSDSFPSSPAVLRSKTNLS